MDNAELRKIIDQYVDDRYYDKDKLLQYLSMHQMVGTEIFDYVDKKSLPGGKQAHSRYWTRIVAIIHYTKNHL